MKKTMVLAVSLAALFASGLTAQSLKSADNIPDRTNGWGRVIDQINTVNDRIRQGLLTFSPSLLDYLECWLVHHSQDEDRRLALFIKARGH